MDKAGFWALLEILEEDARGEPAKFKILAYHKNRELLYEYILEDENWNWKRRYLIVYADPSKCTIDLNDSGSNSRLN